MVKTTGNAADVSVGKSNATMLILLLKYCFLNRLLSYTQEKWGVLLFFDFNTQIVIIIIISLLMSSLPGHRPAL
jgi:hypothetical protein